MYGVCHKQFDHHLENSFWNEDGDMSVTNNTIFNKHIQYIKNKL
jgi:hypothetical protein